MRRALNEHQLTEQREAFVRAYLGDSCGCAADAYRAAYPRSVKWKDNSVYVNASKLLADAKIKLRISELRRQMEDEALLTQTEALRILTRIARVDVSTIIDDDGKIDAEQVKKLGPALSTYVINQGEIKATTHDPVRAIERIAKILDWDAPDKLKVEQVQFELNLGGKGNNLSSGQINNSGPNQAPR